MHLQRLDRKNPDYDITYLTCLQNSFCVSCCEAYLTWCLLVDLKPNAANPDDGVAPGSPLKKLPLQFFFSL